MKIRITADSTCDLSKELIERYNVEIVPLLVVKGDKTLRDGLEITPADIFSSVAAGEDIPTTAAVNSTEYREVFERVLQDCDAVIHINISSEFSSCHQNARLAAEDLNVYCIDSRNLSTGSGLLVMEAGDLIAKGMEPAAIAEELRALTEKVESSFVIDTLAYLHKGGRCSTVAALGANLLKLRPCIEVKDGKMHVGKKYRGAFERCIKQYVTERLKDRDDLRLDRIFVTHSMCDAKTVQVAKDAVRANAEFAEIYETVAGCTISCHCGPGTLGILFIRK